MKNFSTPLLPYANFQFEIVEIGGILWERKKRNPPLADSYGENAAYSYWRSEYKIAY